MTWVRIDDGMPDSLKVAPLSDAAFRAYVTSICYSARSLSDGFVPIKKAREFSGRARVVQELVNAGLWDAGNDGYTVHDYLEYNPSRESVLAERDAAKERMKRARSGNVRANTQRTNGGNSPSPSPSRPLTPIKQERDNEPSSDPADAIAIAFGRFGRVNAGTAAAIDETIKDYGIEWTQLAVKRAQGSGFEGSPPWSYVDSICERWQLIGGPENDRQFQAVSNNARRRPGRGSGAEPDATDAWQQYVDRFNADNG